jgi:flagellar biosynthesis protein FlhG
VNVFQRLLTPIPHAVLEDAFRRAHERLPGDPVPAKDLDAPGEGAARSERVTDAPESSTLRGPAAPPASLVSAAAGTLVNSTRASREIWAVGGGKGGIGKSLITSNLGISLARAGRRVVLIDADLGGANLHTCLGIPEPRVTLTDFVARRVRDIEDILIRTGVPNLSLISGAHDFLSAANLNFVQKTMLLRRIADLDADVVILDLGAGTTFNTLDFFLLAQKGIVIAVPEPTSIENCYRFIKSAFYRRLRRVVASASVKRLIEAAMDQKNVLGIRTPSDLLDRIAQMDPAVGGQIREEVSRFRPRIIMNQARTRADVEIGDHMRSACRKYFGIQVEYLGAIDYDDVVWQSIRRREPLLLKHPGSVSARSVERIAARLLQGS